MVVLVNLLTMHSNKHGGIGKSRTALEAIKKIIADLGDEEFDTLSDTIAVKLSYSTLVQAHFYIYLDMVREDKLNSMDVGLTGMLLHHFSKCNSIREYWDSNSCSILLW